MYDLVATARIAKE